MIIDEIDFGNLPKDRVLVLIDIDDTLNVFHGCADGTSYYGTPALWHGDEYRKALDAETMRAFTANIAKPYDIDMSAEITIGKNPDSAPSRFIVNWSSELAASIASAVGNGLIEIGWLTSWKRYAGYFEETVFGKRISAGYLDWYYRGFSDPGIYGKELAVSELFPIDPEAEELLEAENAPADSSIEGMGEAMEMRRKMAADAKTNPHGLAGLVVMDNEAIGFGGHDFFANAVGKAVPELTISPDPAYGVTKCEWEAVLGFAGKYRK
jgi:hypothetical protein